MGEFLAAGVFCHRPPSGIEQAFGYVTDGLARRAREQGSMYHI